MGNDRSEYPWDGQDSTFSDKASDMADTASDMADRASEQVADLTDAATQKMEPRETISETPEMIRQKTRGNPLAAGLIALGAGALVGSAFPETNTEQKALRQAQLAMDKVQQEVKEKGQAMADDLRESARDAAENVKHEAQRSGERLQHEAEEAVDRTRSQTG